MSYSVRRNAGSHPRILSYTADALWSINERLAGNPGLELDRLGVEWLDDMMELAIEEGERLEEDPELSLRDLEELL